MTLGKAIGCGLPVERDVRDPRIADLFSVESYGGVPHASTLAGSCIPMAVSARMFEVIERDGLVERAAILGERLMDELADRSGRLPIKEVRGRGLFIGVELDDGYPMTASDVVREALDRGSCSDRPETGSSASRHRSSSARASWNAASNSSPSFSRHNPLLPAVARTSCRAPGRAGYSYQPPSTWMF